jgi:hypothetical protein
LCAVPDVPEVWTGVLEAIENDPDPTPIGDPGDAGGGRFSTEKHVSGRDAFEEWHD